MSRTYRDVPNRILDISNFDWIDILRYFRGHRKPSEDFKDRSAEQECETEKHWWWFKSDRESRTRLNRCKRHQERTRMRRLIKSL